MPAGIMPEAKLYREERKIDQVNRLTIPTGLRSRLGNTVYLLKDFQTKKCIIAYSEERILAVYDAIANTYSGAELTYAQRLFTENIDMVIMDKSGRITLKPEYLEFAGITDMAYIVAQPDKIEIWNKSRFDEDVKEAFEKLDLSKFNLSPRL